MKENNYADCIPCRKQMVRQQNKVKKCMYCRLQSVLLREYFCSSGVVRISTHFPKNPKEHVNSQVVKQYSGNVDGSTYCV